MKRPGNQRSVHGGEPLEGLSGPRARVAFTVAHAARFQRRDAAWSHLSAVYLLHRSTILQRLISRVERQPIQLRLALHRTTVSSVAMLRTVTRPALALRPSAPRPTPPLVAGPAAIVRWGERLLVREASVVERTRPAHRAAAPAAPVTPPAPRSPRPVPPPVARTFRRNAPAPVEPAAAREAGTRATLPPGTRSPSTAAQHAAAPPAQRRDAVDVAALTEEVIRALDRRVVAHRERFGKV